MVAPDSLTIDEGGFEVFTMRLATEPSQRVLVTVWSGDPGAVSVPLQVLTFTTNNLVHAAVGDGERCRRR